LEEKWGKCSMTQPAEIVESPFGRRHVQITIAAIVSVAFVWLSVTSWHAFNCKSDPRPDLAATDDSADALDAALIQIDLNTAEPRELALLPGVGPILARRIVDNRAGRGPYLSLDDLGRVHGIGPKILQRVQHICIVDPRTIAQQRGSQGTPASALGRSQRLASAAEIDVPNRKDSFDRSGR
jgi:hypothetical protein